MNRLEQWSHDLGMLGTRMLSIFSVCEDLHGALCGTGEGIQSDIIHRYGQALRRRLDNWQPSLGSWSCKQYDDAVKALVVAALVEYESAVSHGRLS